jgi:hypothetical protein
MKLNLNIRWIAIGLMWAGTIFFTFWNINKIGLIMTEVEKDEVFRMDDIFWINNSKNISKVLAQRDSLRLPIESTKLGLFSVENSLTALALKHNFGEIQIESTPEQTGEVGIPIKLSFEGPFRGIISWLNALEHDFPYLPVRHAKITADPFSKQAKFQFWISFGYKLSNPANMN